MKDQTLFKRYVSKMESIKHDRFKNINEDLLNGQNSYMRMRMKGSSFFNDEWIKKIEDCVYELGQIVNNPLEVTTTEGSLTPVELAKKINYESIQHLASHTQYIKNIDEEGNVIPAKILSQFHKEQLHTYENKFIATFIRRLVLFVEKRYDFIKNTVNFDTKEILFVKNKSVVDGQEVEIETKVTLKKANEDAESKAGREFVKRVEAMRRYVNYFYNSPFMKELKTEKNVRKPILQTNIIRKNPLYRKCYETFLFIEKFSSLGVGYTLDQHYQEFDEKERKNLNYILTSNLLSLEASESSKVYKKSNKVYKPKLLNSCDDEVFLYGDLLKGPIEFVRADEGYLKYLNGKIKKDIPQYPNKVEKEYYKDEIEEKREIKAELKEIDALLKRVRREIAKWEKKVEKLIAERNIEEAREAEAKLEALRKEEDRILEQKRREIIAAAQDNKSEIKEAELARKKEEEEKARLQAEEEARKALEEIRLAEEAAKKAAEEEAARIAAEEAIKKAAEEEAARLAEEEAAKAAEEEAIRKAVEEAKQAQAEEEAAEEPASVEEAQAEPVIEEIKTEEPVEEVLVVEEQVEETVEAKVEETPVVEEQPKVEEPKVEEKAEEKKAPAKKKAQAKKKAPAKKSTTKKSPAKKAKPKAEEAPVKEAEPKVETPVEEVKPVEPMVEKVAPIEVSAPVEEQPAVIEEVAPAEEPAPIEEKLEAIEQAPAQEKAPAKKAPAKKSPAKPKSTEKTADINKPKAAQPKKKPAKKQTKKPAEKPTPAPVEEVKNVFEKIPGRFIVKSNKGYVISKSEFSNVKSQARVFDDFNEARRYKAMFGGKVIKL